MSERVATYWSKTLNRYVTIPGPDRVAPDAVCPNCHEERVDWLVWDEDGETVTCWRCGATYDPSEVK